MVARDLERGVRGELLFNGYRVLLLQDERVLEMDGAYDCTIIWMCLNHWIVYTKMVKILNFMPCVFC